MMRSRLRSRKARWPAMVPVPTEPRKIAAASLLLLETEEPRRLNAAVLPSVLHDLSEVQRHILGRVAVHGGTHEGAIPFVAPTAHQFALALELAAPGVHLLEVAVSPVTFRQSFRLTRLGGYVVRRLFRLVPPDDDRRHEL